MSDKIVDMTKEELIELVKTLQTKTNAEKIRAMSNNELAQFLSKVMDYCRNCGSCEFCAFGKTCNTAYYFPDAKWQKWLNDTNSYPF
jgi:hypothetical protein